MSLKEESDQALHAAIKKAFDIDAFTRLRRTKASLENLRELPCYFFKKIEYQFLPFYFGCPPKWRVWIRSLTFKNRVLPDFAVVGPVKSGSSDFCAMLLCHESIVMPLVKELPPFLYQKRVETYYPTQARMKLVEETYGQARTGYFAPWLAVPGMVEYLKKLGVKKILLPLRDPVRRAYSHWKWEIFLAKSRGQRLADYFMEFRTYVERCMELFPESPPTYCGVDMLRSGIYVSEVNEFLERFGEDSVLFLNMDDYFCNRSKILDEAAAFLGLRRYDWLIDTIPINENPLKFDPADRDTNELLARFYYPYNQSLFKVIGREFSWISPETS